jgi:hypothetical protein
MNASERDDAIRVCLDLNVLIASEIALAQGRRGTATRNLVEAVRDGRCPAGPLQLVVSWAMIAHDETKLGEVLSLEPALAAERAFLLAQYAEFVPRSEPAHIILGGTGVIELSRGVMAKRRKPEDLISPEQEDRQVLETAIAGRADILVTSDHDLLSSARIATIESDARIYRTADWDLVVAKPQMVWRWLREGRIPRAAMLAAR